MESAFLAGLPRWVNFYVIVGSSAGALTGLQFIVITLIAQSGLAASRREIRAFGTPTVIHFCVALLIASAMTLPWPAVSHLSACLAVMAVIGSIYSLAVIVHAMAKIGYSPDVEDWFWYAGLPLLAYIILGVAAILVRSLAVWSLFVIAAVTISFLLIGIRNSWDTVTYVTLQRGQRPDDPGKQASPGGV